MSSYLSNLLTQTTTKYNTLKRTLLSNEDDGDTEIDSHISRVLLAYYNEQQADKPWPDWLPPEARKPASQQQGFGGGYAGIWGSNTSNNTPRSQSPQVGGYPASTTVGRAGALDDLWDTTPRPSSARTLPPQGVYGQSMQQPQPSPLGGGASPPNSYGSGRGAGLSASERLKRRVQQR